MKIKQITFADGYLVALTEDGKLFRRFGIQDSKLSYWEEMDVPLGKRNEIKKVLKFSKI
jgi:hypothetical protein